MTKEALSPLGYVWRHYRATVAFIFLGAFMVFVYWRVDVEADQRKKFDDRRQYDICLGGNEYRKDLAEALRGFRDDLIAAAAENPEPGDDNTEAIAAYVMRTEKRLAPLDDPRDCRALLKTP